jgi:hypothetical protein
LGPQYLGLVASGRARRDRGALCNAFSVGSCGGHGLPGVRFATPGYAGQRLRRLGFAAHGIPIRVILAASTPCSGARLVRASDLVALTPHAVVKEKQRGIEPRIAPMAPMKDRREAVGSIVTHRTQSDRSIAQFFHLMINSARENSVPHSEQRGSWVPRKSYPHSQQMRYPASRSAATSLLYLRRRRTPTTRRTTQDTA